MTYKFIGRNNAENGNPEDLTSLPLTQQLEILQNTISELTELYKKKLKEVAKERVENNIFIKICQDDGIGRR